MLLPAFAARLPCHSSANVIDQKSYALVIGRIQPEHALENMLSLHEPVQPPKAQSKSIHATEKRPVIDPAPGKQTHKVFAERQFAYPNTHFVMPNRQLGPDSLTGSPAGDSRLPATFRAHSRHSLSDYSPVSGRQGKVQTN